MANKDGTGPEGKGARTGRQMGNCEKAEPVTEKEVESCGKGFGRGRGFRNRRD